MNWNPHRYQLNAVKLLVQQGSAGLFLDPGLGKTSITLAAFHTLRHRGLVSKMLVIAPLQVVRNTWPDEIAKWLDFSHLRVSIVHGPKKQEALEADADVYLINYEGIPWLFDKQHTRYKTQKFDILCVDESTKLKDPSTKRFKALRPHVEKFERRWILTGTPVPRSMMDLFGQMYVLDTGRALGRYITHYRNEFFHRKPGDQFGWHLNHDAFDNIMKRIDPLVLRLKAEDWLSMPEQVIPSPIAVELSPWARKVYDEVERDFISFLSNEDVIVAANTAVAGGKCRQIANGAIYTQGTAEYREVHEEKLEALENLVEELNGSPLLVAYEFDHDRQRLLRRFGPETPVIGRGTTPNRATELLREFNQGQHPVLFVQPATASHGLNLQAACNHLCWFSIPWNLEHYMQLIARIWRQGQKEKSVFIYHIVAKHTLDEVVMSRLAQKDATQESVLSAITEKVL